MPSARKSYDIHDVTSRRIALVDHGSDGDVVDDAHFHRCATSGRAIATNGDRFGQLGRRGAQAVESITTRYLIGINGDMHGPPRWTDRW